MVDRQIDSGKLQGELSNNTSSDDETSGRQKGQKEETSSVKEFRERALGHIIEKDLAEAV